MKGLCFALVAPMVALMIVSPSDMIPAMAIGVCLLAGCIYLMNKVIGKK